MATDPRTQAFEKLAQQLVSEDSLEHALTAMLQILTEAVPAASHAGLSTGDSPQRPATPVFTNPKVPDMDQAQYDSGRGPCLDAWRTGTVVRIDDLSSAADRYAEFVAAAHDHEIRSTLSIPVIVQDRSVGAINLYSETIGGITAEDEQLALDLAPASGAFLVNAQAYWHAFELTQQLNEALASRSIIDQAKGILMAANPELDADGAFELLRDASQRENTKLRDLAKRITERRGPEGPGLMSDDSR
ncbi:MAG: transcriptional regulator [Ilumatobacteraceae bacterium]|nr:transcriptional regulator [Ilumatobacteraceae bacterium]